ncbi:hypothetical protein ACTFIU_009009 [Dictyostelium citrinum]
MITCPECKTEYEKEAKYCFKCRIAFTDDLPENISKYLRRTPSTSNITSTPIVRNDKPPLTRNPSATGSTITQHHYKPPLSGGNTSSVSSPTTNVFSTNYSSNINSNNNISNSSSLSSGSLNNGNISLINSVGSIGSNSSTTTSSGGVNSNMINSGGGSRPRLQSSPVHPTNPLPPLPPNNSRMSVPVSTSPTVRTPPPPPTTATSTGNSPINSLNNNNSNNNNNNNNINNINNNIISNKPQINSNNRTISPINTPTTSNTGTPLSNSNDFSNISSPQFTNDVNNTAPLSRRPLSRRIPPPPPTKKLARAKWDCVPEQEGDLAFVAGDIITIISKDDDGSGWWLGSVNNVAGMFPGNYCEEI